MGAEGGELLSQEKARFQVGPREGESIKRRIEDGKAQAPEIRWKKTRRGGIYGVMAGAPRQPCAVDKQPEAWEFY